MVFYACCRSLIFFKLLNNIVFFEDKRTDNYFSYSDRRRQKHILSKNKKLQAGIIEMFKESI